VRERVVMSISGHRSRSSFDRYNITSEQDLVGAAAQLNAARKAAPSSSGTLSGTIMLKPVGFFDRNPALAPPDATPGVLRARPSVAQSTASIR
jgi:hypothetical protein